MKESLALQLLEEELERLQRYNSVLRDKMENLPKGTLRYKKGKRTNNRYANLFFYQNGKMNCKYIGREDSEKVINLKKKLNEYKEIQEELKENEIRIKGLKKILKIK